MTIHRNTKRYSLLAGILILIGFALYFPAAHTHVTKMLLKERVIDEGVYLECICETLDFMASKYGMEEEKIKESLIYLVARIDAIHDQYAELMDDQLNTIAARTFDDHDGRGFDPRKFPEFMDKVKASEFGSDEIMYAPQGQEPFALYLQWRWVPTGDYDNKVLMIIGVSPLSVNTRLADWMIYGIVGLFIVTTVYIVWSMMILSVGEPKTKRGV